MTGQPNADPDLQKLFEKDHLAFTPGEEPYALGPDSLPQAGVPRGEILPFHWKSERIYPGTERDYWVYVPQQYSPTQPACLMVFQDGAGYARENSELRTPIVFDNLIHQGRMPVTIGVYVDPGHFPPAAPDREPASNRCVEYNTLSDRYARFLLEEILPEVGRQYRLTENPDGRAI
ncbi:MAG: hypothetical protein IH586_05345, partial [Anaerolineaceae bacterium]|nr:hypothetical protein [Anaerolineaceae bacterium]